MKFKNAETARMELTKSAKVLNKLLHLEEVLAEIEDGLCDVRIRRRVGDIQELKSILEFTDGVDVLNTIETLVRQDVHACYMALLAEGIDIGPCPYDAEGNSLIV